jgi:ABC-type uncharacterized transport system involved in gliding motility auxiliary subunit
VNQRAPILGITGLVLLFFGVLEHWLAYNPMAPLNVGWFAALHMGGGLACLLWYFSRGTGSLRAFVRARSTRYGAGALVYSVVFVAAIVMVNFLGTRYNKRIDWSTEGVNSLSEQSHQVLDRLDEDVDILAFVEPKDSAFIEQIAGIYGYASDRVRISVLDPQIRPELAQREGINSVPTLVVRKGERNTRMSELSEEAITNAIHQVSNQETRKVYFVEGHGEPPISDQETPTSMGLFADALSKQNYEVEGIFLGKTRTVPEDASVLVVASSQKPYLAEELESIREWIARGGSTLVLLEPTMNPELVELVEPFGIEVGDDVILDQQVRLFEGPTVGLEPVVSEYGQHPAVAAMKERTIFSLARSVEPAGALPEGAEVASIAITGETSWAETDTHRVFASGEARMDDNDRPGPVSLAVAVSGALAAEDEDRGKPFRMVVFGDNTFLTNRYLRQLFNDALGTSTVAWLSGQDELIAIGPRVVRASRAYLSETQARSVFYLSVLVLPELILLLGIATWWRRSAL